MNLRRLAFLLALAALVAGHGGIMAKQVDPPVSPGRDGRLQYVTDARGDRIVEFSHAGYRGGGVALPDLPARVVVPPAEGEDGARIQAALDFVAGLPADPQGLRGAVQLEKGRYEVAGRLRLRTGGVVLRGAGADAAGTVLVAIGTDRRPLVEIGGANRPALERGIPISDTYVPVGAVKLRLRSAAGFAAGASVIVERPSTAAWITQLGMHEAPGRQPYEWKPDTLNVRWERRIAAVASDGIVLDAPLTAALDASLGGGLVFATAPADVANVGVENLRCESAYDRANPVDEEHAWTAVHIGRARDVWIADLTAVHFPGSAVHVSAAAARVTVQDCASLDPVSEAAGYRRLAFHTLGQQTLFLRCTSQRGRHDFSAGHLAPGPNVFLDCVADDPRDFSGSIGSWATGLLFDNVRIDGAALRLDNLETWNQGVGWAAGNSMIWQSVASTIVCRAPPGATNWAVGPWAQFVGDGRWAAVNEFVEPDSLYRTQLAERLGAAARDALLARSYVPASPVAERWDAVAARLGPRPAAPALPAGLQMANGWIALGDRLAAGGQQGSPMWQGHLLPARSPDRGPALTRFVPDRFGLGATDDLAELVDTMRAQHQVAFRHHWGLWYDRRRDDHEMIRRPDGDVWPPFFEQPWARSGQGRTANGLTRYDLTKFNPWYFGRLREFAGLARERGLVLVNEMYFQHNILEAGAHWVDFPWRPANSVQETGFPEPPPFVGGKRIFVAEYFYDVTHPVRRALHRDYIRQCLANLAGHPNVIHTVGEEFTGPLPFVQFWLDVAAEWMAETRHRPLLALSATKDVQDAILVDPRRAELISVIDLKYWWLSDKGLHAPGGGENLAPRQHERLWKGGRPSAPSIARMVREYRGRFPDKAVITGLGEADGWAFVAAGGSFPKLPAGTDPALLAALVRMRPASAAVAAPWILAEPGVQYFGYAPAAGMLRFEVGAGGAAFAARRIDLETGHVAGELPVSRQDGVVTVTLDGPGAVWLRR